MVKTICTTRTDPDDETSPLKYGKVRKLIFNRTPNVTSDDIKLIVENLTELTHLDLEYLAGVVTDQTITALLATEHVDPAYPSTTLPNLTHLNLCGSSLTCEGLMALSQSSLFSQLEYLNLAGSAVGPWNIRDSGPLPPGLQALLANSRVTNLQHLNLRDLIEPPNCIFTVENLVKKDPAIAKLFQYLGKCRVTLYYG